MPQKIQNLDYLKESYFFIKLLKDFFLELIDS